MEQKAQVNLEYMFIIVGVVVIVTVVSLYIKTAANSAADAVQAQADTNA